MGWTNFTVRSLEELQKMEGLHFTDMKAWIFRDLLKMRGLEQKYLPDRLPNDRDKILKEKLITKIKWSQMNV